MKFFIGFLVLLTLSFNGYTQTVSHSHGGKAHSHPLPKNGINHTHRGVNGAGTLLKNNTNNNINKTTVDPFTRKTFLLTEEDNSYMLYFVDDKFLILNEVNSFVGEDISIQEWHILEDRRQKYLCVYGGSFNLSKSFDSHTVGSYKNWKSDTHRCSKLFIEDPSNTYLIRDTSSSRKRPIYHKYNINIADGDKYDLMSKFLKKYSNFSKNPKWQQNYREPYNIINSALQKSSGYKNSDFRMQQIEKERIKKITAEKKRRLQENHRKSKRYFTLKVGFSKGDTPSVNHRQLPNLSLTTPISPNKTQTTITYPVVIAGKSNDGKYHTAKVKVILEMKVKVVKLGCVGGIGHCRDESTEIKTDSQIINISLQPNKIFQNNISLRLTNTELDISSPIFGTTRKYPEQPRLRYEILDWK